MKAFFALTLVALFGLTLAPARADDQYQRTLDKSMNAAGARALNVTGYNGNVHLFGDSGSTVRIHAVLGARSADALKMLDVRTERSGESVRVTDVCPSTRHFFFWSAKDCDIQLEIHYPRAMTASLVSENGNVVADRPGGAVSI